MHAIIPSFNDIVVIEHDRELRIRLAGNLAKYCKYLFVFDSLRESYRHLQKKQAPSVIITDFCLPDGNSTDLIKSYTQQSNIIVMSKSAKPEEAFLLGQLGVQSFIDKPINISKVHKALSNIYMSNQEIKFSITTFGGLHIYKQGIEIPYSRKTPYKVLELIACIAACGGRNVSISSICDYLWPELEGDKARKNFTTCLRRARDLFGTDHHDVIIRKSLLVSFNPTKVIIDLWRLEEDKNEDLQPQLHPLSKQHFTQTLLPEYDFYWLIQLRKKYTSIINRLHQFNI